MFFPSIVLTWAFNLPRESRPLPSPRKTEQNLTVRGLASEVKKITLDLRIVLGEVLDSEKDNIQKIFHSVIDPIESRVSVPAESDSWGLPAAGSDSVGSASSGSDSVVSASSRI
jgi:hypothetical protein